MQVSSLDSDFEVEVEGLRVIQSSQSQSSPIPKEEQGNISCKKNSDQEYLQNIQTETEEEEEEEVVEDCRIKMHFVPESPSTSAHSKEIKYDIFKEFNSRNAKIIACSIVCGFVLYHSFLRVSHGIDTCKWLLSDGNFRDQVWQPYGCMMHHYNHVDSRRCMKYVEYWGGKNYFVFIGDTRIEQMYHSFIRQIAPNYQWSESATTKKFNNVLSSSTTDPNFIDPFKLAQHDLSFNDSLIGLRVQFIWHPYPNQSMVTSLQQWKVSKDWPKVIVIGTGGWTLRDSKYSPESSSIDPFVNENYSSSLTRLMFTLDTLVEEGATVLWALQEPVDTLKLNKEWSALTNEHIDSYNQLAQKVLRYSKATVWSSGRSVAVENFQESIDGYHLGSKTLVQDSQILLNMYCNDNMNYNDATCCSNLEKISSVQQITFCVLGFCVFIHCTILVRKYWSGAFSSRNVTYEPMTYKGVHSTYEPNEMMSRDVMYKPYIALSKLALIMTFFFICDRTTMFMKENKYFTQTNFWLPVIYVLVLGIFFTEDSVYTKVLHYDQESEVKGWMVLLILVYNMMGASQVLPIFMFVKILYSAFLFLHGWNQFLNFLQRGDYSIVRFLQDLFRLNLMAVLLCLCMNRPYQFYDFIPLISFWTLVTYVGLSIPPRITWTACEVNTLNYLYIVLKLVGIFSFTTILYMSEVFFEKVFITRPWKALFVSTDDDIHDWWTRWKIDRYSMPFGMVLAFGYHLAKKYKILEDDNHGNLFSTRISLSAVLFSLLGIGAYCTFSVVCRNQLECIEIHSYVGFIPITGYIILRNVSGILRTRFSSFFAWFGQFWVELLVGQYHVWMGADGHGVLVLVPSYPVGNVLLTAFVFAFTAHEVRICTDVLLPYAVPDDWRKALRNLLIFLLVLVPIGVHDGMF